MATIRRKPVATPDAQNLCIQRKPVESFQRYRPGLASVTMGAQQELTAAQHLKTTTTMISSKKKTLTFRSIRKPNTDPGNMIRFPMTERSTSPMCSEQTRPYVPVRKSLPTGACPMCLRLARPAARSRVQLLFGARHGHRTRHGAKAPSCGLLYGSQRQFW